VRQILLNLMSNAIKFTPTGGTVELIVGVPDDQTVVLAVKDSGVGIPEEDIDRIFRPFEQSMAHGMRGEAGTGLGLPLSRQLAELHGARISVESRVNEGSVFALVLPPERYVSGETEQR
jgi:two-component system cell cycle sensor histidine kinase PleC